MLTLIAAATANGAPNSAATANAPSNANCPVSIMPSRLNMPILVPNINTGAYKGNIKIANKTPPRAKEIVKAAPIAPTKNKINVHNTKIIIITAILGIGKDKINAKIGVRKIMGTSKINQCTKIFTKINKLN
jgi:hypothetical protein